MPNGNEIANKVIEQTSGVIEKVYDDIAHSTVKSVGNTISFIPRTIGVWLSKWEKWIINGEESIRLTAQAVQEKAKSIPEDKLTEPESYVAIPAIQQLSYCFDSDVLREMYANLLLSSMNTDTKFFVHPAFVDIIKQLSPDEAKLLKVLPKTTVQYNALIDLQLNFSVNRGHISLLRNYTDIGIGVCEAPENICAYIDNLDRLKLITVMEEIHLMDANKYTSMESSQFVIDHKKTPLEDGESFSIKRKSFVVTEFGLNFINTCVDS